jgi:hypothetical protein
MEKPLGTSGATISYGCPEGQCKIGLKPREKKGIPFIDGPYLDEVFHGFSGYIAIDEVYDGPFCILTIVDNRNFQRLTYEVLDHSPKHADIIKFMSEFRQILIQKNLSVQGITTDGSPLYPEPLKLLFPGVSHQLCEFHVIKEITKAILKALTQVRKEIKNKIPKVKRGRASDATELKTRKVKARLEAKIAELFENRFLLVQRILSAKERRVFQRITKGYPVLRRFREIMNEVYALFDRRCRTATGLKKLAALRKKVLRFQDVFTTLKKILSPNLEKALTFLDDKLLPSTSNAVERANRRFRKMQKAIYHARTMKTIEGRIALDMIRGMRYRRRPQLEGYLRGFRSG